ncbi:hypothetical protein [Actinoallomurus rhizosphaericola]|uniref:hypothetical protein n=1 Tax=Actinoallomurus rhizosphaericola TaxID=2952536 RepID=UPI0020934D9F|nr:hypothetical protein [Actinoallomurus rhizosphaericola]MCO5999612.1 hypothetical protein [Actinoallomurus rhizosphaericola]
MASRIRIGLLAALAITVLGVPIGLLWVAIAPRTAYQVSGGKGLLADPETETLIAADGWFAVLTVAAGLLCGVAAYVLAGRLGEQGLLVGIAAGGLAAAIVAWRLGHLVGQSGYRHALRTAGDGTLVHAPLGLHAYGVVLAWPLTAVVVFGLLEALDVANRESRAKLAAGDAGGGRPGQADEVGGGELDLEAAPTGRDVDRREP